MPGRLTRRSALMLAPALAACRPAGARPLSFWAMGYEGDYAPLLLPGFTQATGIAVQVQSLPWTEAHEKLLTACAGGALPDVMMLPDAWVGEFAMIGALAPLDDVAPLGDAAPLAGLVPGAAAGVRQGGRDWAIPWSMAPQVQFYRRDLLAQAGYDGPPTDWDGWRGMGRALRRRRPGSYAFLLLLNWWDALFSFLAQIGAPLLRERDTLGNFRSPEAREALAYYVSLFDEGLAPRVLSTEVEDPLAAFAQGYFAIYPSDPTLLVDLHRRQAEIPPDRWGIQRMPGPHGPGPVSSTSASLAVSAATRRPEAAQALRAYLVSPASELRLQRLIGRLPAARAAWSALAGDPLLAPFAAQLRDPAAAPRIVEWERLRIEVQRVAEAVVRGDLTIDAGLAEMDRRTDRILRQRRALVLAGRLA